MKPHWPLSFLLIVGALHCSAGADTGEPTGEDSDLRSSTPAGALARGAQVPGRYQRGGTCGLYALGMAMDRYDALDAKNLTVHVLPDDGPFNATRPSDNDDFLLARAKSFGFTKCGEMISATDEATLAEHYGYQTRVVPNATVADIKASLDRHHPVLMAFDVANDGNVTEAGGDHAHWAILEGHMTRLGRDYFVGRHGWLKPQASELIFDAEAFVSSSRQLDTMPLECEGVPRHLVDVRPIAGYMIEVFP